MNYDLIVAPKAVPGSIRNWINYDPVPMEEILRSAESYIYGKLRAREMLNVATIRAQGGKRAVPLPVRYVETDSIRDLSNGRELEWNQPARLSRNIRFNPDIPGVLTADPAYYTTVGAEWQFDAIFPSDRDLLVTWFAAPEPLGPTNQTNFLTDRYPELLRHACLMLAAAFRRDTESENDWKAQVQEGLAAATIENKLDGGDEDLETAFSEVTDWGNVASPAILQDAESYIYSVLRAREMRVSVPFVIPEDASDVPLPEGFLDPIILEGRYGEVRNTHEASFLRSIQDRTPDGPIRDAEFPSFYATLNERVYFDRRMRSEVTLTFSFFQRPAPLGPNNRANFLTRRYSHLLRDACLMYVKKQKGANQQELTTHKSLLDEALTRAGIEQDFTRRDQFTPVHPPAWGHDDY